MHSTIIIVELKAANKTVTAAIGSDTVHVQLLDKKQQFPSQSVTPAPGFYCRRHH